MSPSILWIVAKAQLLGAVVTSWEGIVRLLDGLQEELGKLGREANVFRTGTRARQEGERDTNSRYSEPN